MYLITNTYIKCEYLCRLSSQNTLTQACICINNELIEIKPKQTIHSNTMYSFARDYSRISYIIPNNVQIQKTNEINKCFHHIIFSLGFFSK